MLVNTYAILSLLCQIEISIGKMKLVFEPNSYYGILRDGRIDIGKIDIHGRFTIHFANNNPNNPSSGYPIFQILNCTSDFKNIVYELRDDKLYLGELAKNGVFIANKDSRVILLSDYKIGLFTPRIWNYPRTYSTK